MIQRGKNPFNVPTLSAMNTVCSSRLASPGHHNQPYCHPHHTLFTTAFSFSPGYFCTTHPQLYHPIIFPVAFCRKNPLCQTLSCDITGKSSVTFCHANSAPATSAYLSVSALAAQAAFSHLCLVAFFPRPLQSIYRFRA